jgi:hypothetical protein
LGKLPAIQFYPGDWRKDVGVQSLSYHDRGVWFEMLMLMHESPVRGKLMIGDKGATEELIAGVLHIEVESFKVTVATLLERGICDRDSRTGALMNRRMVRDEDERSKNRRKLAKWRKEQKTNEECNQPVTQKKPLPSSSSSITSSSSTSVSKYSRATLEEIFNAYPRRVAKEAAILAIDKALRKSGKEPAAMLQLVEAYAEQRAKEDPQFTPHPATWFNQGRYDDETLKPKPKLIWEAV